MSRHTRASKVLDSEWVSEWSCGRLRRLRSHDSSFDARFGYTPSSLFREAGRGVLFRATQLHSAVYS